MNGENLPECAGDYMACVPSTPQGTTAKTMSPERINQVLAERMGWKFEKNDDGSLKLFNPMENRWVGIDNDPASTPDWYTHLLQNYFSSRDALFPVLLGLTDEEKGVVAMLIADYALNAEEAREELSWQWIEKMALDTFNTFLAVPNETLAIAVVKAIGKWEEEP